MYTDSPEKTEDLAYKLGLSLRGGEIVELISDLGGGKTTFTRGLAKGTGSTDVVASPTFTVSKVYKAPNFQIHHFDFYRLGNDPGLVANELEELIGDKNAIVVLEWADTVGDILPNERLSVRIQSVDEGRRIILEFPKKYSYLSEKL